MADHDQTQGRIILLNGTSSAGKTTLARTLQMLAAEPLHCIALDEFRDGMAGRFRGINAAPGEPGARGLNVVPQQGATALRFGDVGRLTLRAMRRAVAAVAGVGLDVVVDDLLLEDDFLDDYLRVLAPFDVTFVAVYCDVPTLAQREKARRDRFPGTAQLHRQRIHAGCVYDIEVDTARATPRQCARRVLAYWNAPRAPSAFERLRAERGSADACRLRA